MLAGCAGMLPSPARGLLVFSPFLPSCLRRYGMACAGARALTLAISGALAQLLFYAKADWRAGYSWGPRWLTDLLPLLVWLLPLGIATLRRFGRALFALAACASIAVQCVGAFWYIGASEGTIFAGPAGADEMHGAWEARNSPILAELRHPPAHPDPAFLPWRKIAVRGTLDRATANGLSAETVTAGTRLLLEGWALADERAPGAVQATLDGSLRGSTEVFIDSDDVRAALHTAELTGSRLEVDTRGLGPGRHALTLRAQLRDSALTIPFAWKEIAVVDAGIREAGAHLAPPALSGTDPLAEAARRAAARLQSHQEQAGYWLTQYTGVTRFEAPHPEMNTFLTAMMIDQLQPIAAKVDLGASVAAARAHLRGQIEGSGLVRYHGLPEAPTPAPSAAASPDSDDTSPAWRPARGSRVAPPALTTLAATAQRRSLPDVAGAPGALRVHQPWKQSQPDRRRHPDERLPVPRPGRASRRASSLSRPRPALAEDQSGSTTPWRRSYCCAAGQPHGRRALRFPPARLTTTVAGQEPCSRSPSRSLRRRLVSPRPGREVELLRSIADDDFALLRRTPPLLYHNDLSASVRRFYWSEDFGYALWLRLYFATERERRADFDRR